MSHIHRQFTDDQVRVLLYGYGQGSCSGEVQQASTPLCGGRLPERSGRTILVVDDEANIVELVRMYLEREGYRTQAACTGAEALELIARQLPALMILDLMLPEVDGWTVCRQVRAG